MVNTCMQWQNPKFWIQLVVLYSYSLSLHGIRRCRKIFQCSFCILLPDPRKVLLGRSPLAYMHLLIPNILDFYQVSFPCYSISCTRNSTHYLHKLLKHPIHTSSTFYKELFFRNQFLFEVMVMVMVRVSSGSLPIRFRIRVRVVTG